MKKILALLLTISCLSITACASNKTEMEITASEDNNAVEEEVTENEIQMLEVGEQVTINNVTISFDEMYIVTEKIRYREDLGFQDPQEGCHYVVLQGRAENNSGETVGLKQGLGYILVNDQYKYELIYGHFAFIPGNGSNSLEPLVDSKFIIFGEISDKLLDNLSSVDFVFGIDKNFENDHRLSIDSFEDNPEDWYIFDIKSTEIGSKATTLD